MLIKLKTQSFLFPVALFFCGAMFSSCADSKKTTQNLVYFQQGRDTIKITPKEAVIQENDLLNIQVFSRTLNQEQAAIFNLPKSSTDQTVGYRVDQSGSIEMPVLGKVRVEGMVRDQLRADLEKRLTEYVKNPTVIIHFLEFQVNVLGEVKTPGLQKFKADRVNIIDAISAAGDLTDFGKREDVTVIRETDGQRIFYTVDLRDKNMFQSPVFTLQPNDIVYVGPTKSKLTTLSIDREAQRRTGLIFSVLGVMVSVASLVLIAIN